MGALKKSAVLCALLLLLALNAPAWAYPEHGLPADNLLSNPWFRSSADPNLPGLDSWTNELVDGIGWGVSQKVDNPSPNILIAEACEFAPVYCGTSARWGTFLIDGVTYAYPGMDVYLHQVAAADPANRQLHFSMYWVNHRIEVAEVTIYGSKSESGPWLPVWHPISISQDVNPDPCCTPGSNGIPWFETGMLQSVLQKGYPFYRVVLHARYPVPQFASGDVGVKITGVYFTAQFTLADPSPSTPVVIHNPTLPPTSMPRASQAPTQTPALTATPTPHVHPTWTPFPTPAHRNRP